jgi:hypothetical protein
LNVITHPVSANDIRRSHPRHGSRLTAFLRHELIPKTADINNAEFSLHDRYAIPVIVPDIYPAIAASIVVQGGRVPWYICGTPSASKLLEQQPLFRSRISLSRAITCRCAIQWGSERDVCLQDVQRHTNDYFVPFGTIRILWRHGHDGRTPRP